MKELLFTLFMVVATGVNAQVVHYDETDKSVTLSGPTTAAQWVMLNNVIAAKEVRSVKMSGPGGYFYAGLAIGRLIHQHGLTVTIPEGAECVSACAYAALGSPNVYVDGSLLIHRGYFAVVPATSTLDEFARRSGEGYLDGARYLLEMGYTLGLAKTIVTSSSPCVFLDLGSKVFIDQLRSDDPLSIKPNLAMGKVDKCNG